MRTLSFLLIGVFLSNTLILDTAFALDFSSVRNSKNKTRLPYTSHTQEDKEDDLDKMGYLMDSATKTIRGEDKKKESQNPRKSGNPEEPQAFDNQTSLDQTSPSDIPANDPTETLIEEAASTQAAMPESEIIPTEEEMKKILHSIFPRQAPFSDMAIRRQFFIISEVISEVPLPYHDPEIIENLREAGIRGGYSAKGWTDFTLASWVGMTLGVADPIMTGLEARDEQHRILIVILSSITATDDTGQRYARPWYHTTVRGRVGPDKEVELLGQRHTFNKGEYQVHNPNDPWGIPAPISQTSGIPTASPPNDIIETSSDRQTNNHQPFTASVTNPAFRGRNKIPRPGTKSINVLYQPHRSENSFSAERVTLPTIVETWHRIREIREAVGRTLTERPPSIDPNSSFRHFKVNKTYQRDSVSKLIEHISAAIEILKTLTGLDVELDELLRRLKESHGAIYEKFLLGLLDYYGDIADMLADLTGVLNMNLPPYLEENHNEADHEDLIAWMDEVDHTVRAILQKRSDPGLSPEALRSLDDFSLRQKRLYQGIVLTLYDTYEKEIRTSLSTFLDELDELQNAVQWNENVTIAEEEDNLQAVVELNQGEER